MINKKDALFISSGILAYSVSATFLAIQSIDFIIKQGKHNSSDIETNQTHTLTPHPCNTTMTSNISGTLIGIIGSIPAIAFHRTMLHKLTASPRSNIQITLLISCVLLFGVPSGLLNAKVNYTASHVFFNHCNNRSPTWPALLFSISGLISPALSLPAAFLNLIERHAYELLLLSTHVTHIEIPPHIKIKALILIKTRFMSLTQLRSTPSIQLNNLSTKDKYHIAIDKTLLLITGFWMWLSACTSYFYYAKSSMRSITAYLGANKEHGAWVAEYAGLSAWHFTSTVFTLLLNEYLVKPILPDILSAHMRSKPLCAIVLLSLFLAFPYLYVPLSRPNTGIEIKLLDSFSLMMTCLLFASTGLFDLIDKKVCQWKGLPHISRSQQQKLIFTSISSIITTPAPSQSETLATSVI